MKRLDPLDVAEVFDVPPALIGARKHLTLHRPSCRYAADDRTYRGHLDLLDAHDERVRPCGHCRPWTPAMVELAWRLARRREAEGLARLVEEHERDAEGEGGSDL